MSLEALARDFAEEALGLLDTAEDALLAFEIGGEGATARLRTLRRALHTLKGNAGMVGAEVVQAAVHVLEDLAARLEDDPALVQDLLQGIDCLRQEARQILDGRPVDQVLPAVRAIAEKDREVTPALPLSLTPYAETALRVPQERVDRLVAAAGEVVVHETRLQRALASGSLAEARIAGDALQRAVRVLHDQVLRLRTVPIGAFLVRYRRIVRDEALRNGKRAELEIIGTDVEIDKAVLDRLGEILGHLVRNAVVHGIELPEVRERAGKPAVGRVVVRASTHGSQVVVAVEDDGAGIDEEAVRQRARELGLDDSRDPRTLIFESGVTTASLSRSAGRGVGLDAVHKEVVRLGGSVEVQSERGAGTRFVLTVPTSIALERALLCRIADEIYAVPAASVVEAARIAEGQIRWMGAGKALEHRGTFFPLVDPETALGLSTEGEYAVFLQAGATAALRVDALLGQQDFVFQALDPALGERAPVDGAALLADGAVVLRLAPDRLVALAAGRGEVA